MVSSIIVLSENPDLRRRLEFKLREYRGRMVPYHPPELQMDTICKIEVLSALLQDGKVVCWDLGLELFKKYGIGFNTNRFGNACAVINDYIKTGGKNVNGGTGLRS